MFRMLLFLTFRFYDLIYRQTLLHKQSPNLFRTTIATAANLKAQRHKKTELRNKEII